MEKTPLEEMLARHEGYREHVYRCSAGKLTIGYGYNLDAGMPEDEAALLMRFRIGKTYEALQCNISWFDELNVARKYVLVDMAYQLGIGGLLLFKNTLAAMRRGDYDEAAREMLDSKWAKQTPARAKELAGMMRTGE